MVTLLPGPDANYTSDVDPLSLLFAGGEMLNIQAQGGEVPAFSATVTAPEMATLVSPSDAMLVVDTAAGVTASWTGGSGKAMLQLVAVDGSGALDIANCFFDAAAGTGTAPGAALTTFVSKSGSVSLQTLDLVTLAVDGEWQVSVLAESDARGPMGGRAFVPATFE